MSRDRWSEVKALLDEAEAVPPAERRAFLDSRTDGDPDLVREVEELLDLETRAGDFIETPVLDINGPPAHDRVGRRLGPYRLVREVGRGGMGTVYLAERADQEFDQRVAVKVLKRGLDTDEVIRRFRNERQILAGFQHPHVARLLDGGTTDDGLPYLVMEYVEGRPIDVYCRQEDLGVEARLDLFLDACSAVEEAHRRLVVHRDLKPKNILVTEDGSVKLLDFGIAKLLDPAAGETVMTVAGWRLLTPQYASPEQAAGAPVTTSTDVYSLGAVLYRLLAGQVPYELEEQTPAGLTRALAAGPPERPSTRAPAARAPRLAGDLDNIVMKAMHPDTDRRYTSVAQLADDLRRHLDGRPVLAAPDSVGYRVGKFVRRHRLGVAAAVAFLVTVLVFAAVSWVLMQRARQEERTAEAVTVFMRGIISNATPDDREMTVLQAVRLADENLGESLAESPVVRARMALELGRAFSTLGEYEKADQRLTEALDLAQEHLGEDSLVVADAKNELAGLIVHKRQTERLPEAESLTREALAIRLDHYPAESQPVAELQTNLAMILDRAEKFDAADALHRQLFDTWQRLENPVEYATVLNNYGASVSKRGRYEEAIPLLREATEIRRRELGPDHTRTARALSNLASALGNSGDIEASTRAYAEALEISRKRYPDGHRSLVFALSNRGMARFNEGAVSEAADLLREASSMGEKLELEQPEPQAVLERNLARVLIEVDPVQAEAAARKALARYPDDYDGWRLPDARLVLGATLAAQGRFREAEELMVPSYPEIVEAQGEDTRYPREARSLLVDLYEAWGRPEAAEPYRDPDDPGTDDVTAAAL